MDTRQRHTLNFLPCTQIYETEKSVLYVQNIGMRKVYEQKEKLRLAERIVRI